MVYWTWIQAGQIAITVLNLLGIALILTSVNGGGLGMETNPPLFSIEDMPETCIMAYCLSYFKSVEAGSCQACVDCYPPRRKR